MEYDLPVELIQAICYEESHFNKEAISPRGAVGIMQILPDTAEWIATSLHVEGYTVEMLFNEEVNIRFGIYYLSYLRTRFPETPWMIAAYNAGEGRVLQWIDSGINVDSIPFEETRIYLRKVTRAMNRYRNKKMFSFV